MATWPAANTTRAAFVTALGNASNGDTVTIPANIPAGTTEVWASPVSVTKQVTIQGAGAGVGTHTSGAGIGKGGADTGTPLTSLSGYCFTIQLTADGPVRITGIAMSRTGWASSDQMIGIAGKTTSGSGVAHTQVRIDHCRFTNGGRAVWPTGWVYGCIDANRFVNNNIAVGFDADNNRSWEREIQVSTANAMFIENNTFRVDTGRPSGSNFDNEMVYHEDGARSVIRYNYMDTRFATGDASLVVDSHGNFNYWNNNNSDRRGQPLMELYNNVMELHHAAYFIHSRGGIMLSHDNSMTTISGTPPWVLWDEEEGIGRTIGGRSVWPAQDQSVNNFFWNETLNGSPVTIANFSWFPPATTFVQLNRDFFLHAPNGNGGRAEYSGTLPNGLPRYGGSQAAPTASDVGTTTFVPGVAQFGFPYNPYPYPHPLASGAGDTLAPAAPTNLRFAT